MSEIKPCPFCGGEGQYLSVFSTAREQTDLYRIKCQGICGVCGPVKDGREAASFAWNQRHFQIPASVMDVLVEKDAEITKLREALKRVVDWYGTRNNYERLLPPDQQDAEIRLAMLVLTGDDHAPV